MAEQGLNIPEDPVNVDAPIVADPIPEENLIAQNDVVPIPEDDLNIKEEEKQNLKFVPKLKSASFKEEDPVVVAEKAGVWLINMLINQGCFILKEGH